VTSITTASALVNDGGDAYCALLSSGTVSCWGANTFGQLGNGSTRNSTVPIAVMALNGVAAISSDGDESFCALLATQAVDCWGANFTGELGNGTTTASPVPVPVTGLANVMTVVDDGAESYCALLASATVECWGYNAFGQLGNGTTTNSPVPVAVSGITTAVAVTSDGEDSYCAVLQSGAGDCWGANFAGELGNGTTTASSVPVTVSGLVFAVTIAGSGHPAGVGEHAYCAIVSSSRVECWGSNQFGELGDATRTASSVPVIVTGP
jgi:alpha-tubulin suppressor-like RCC1 family protein